MTPELKHAAVRTGDGRSLDVLVTGSPNDLPVVFHHGTPGGVAVYQPMVAAAAERGMRLVLYGRPGYGGSTPKPGRRVADAAADVTAIMDHLGATEFVTAGWSGGGPHALACARLLTGRCLAAATLAGVAPYSAHGLDWLAGMAEDNVREFGAALAGERDLTAMLEAAAPQLRNITGDQLAAAIGDLASASDMEALQGALADWVVATFRAGLEQGIAGWRDDDLAFVRDWGFVGRRRCHAHIGLAGRPGPDGAVGARKVARESPPGSPDTPGARRWPHEPAVRRRLRRPARTGWRLSRAPSEAPDVIERTLGGRPADRAVLTLPKRLLPGCRCQGPKHQEGSAYDGGVHGIRSWLRSKRS